MIRKLNHKLASAPLLPKFVSEGAAMYHELRKRGTSAWRRRMKLTNRSPFLALVFAAVAVVFAILFLSAEKERAVGALLVIAAATVVLAARFGLTDRVRGSIGANERTFDAAVVVGVLVTALWFHEEHFVLLMMTTSLLLMVAALGLTVQFGYAGIVNFAGSAFLGI